MMYYLYHNDSNSANMLPRVQTVVDDGSEGKRYNSVMLTHCISMIRC